MTILHRFAVNKEDCGSISRVHHSVHSMTEQSGEFLRHEELTEEFKQQLRDRSVFPVSGEGVPCLAAVLGYSPYRKAFDNMQATPGVHTLLARTAAAFAEQFEHECAYVVGVYFNTTTNSMFVDLFIRAVPNQMPPNARCTLALEQRLGRVNANDAAERIFDQGYTRHLKGFHADQATQLPPVEIAERLAGLMDIHPDDEFCNIEVYTGACGAVVEYWSRRAAPN